MLRKNLAQLSIPFNSTYLKKLKMYHLKNGITEHGINTKFGTVAQNQRSHTHSTQHPSCSQSS